MPMTQLNISALSQWSLKYSHCFTTLNRTRSTVLHFYSAPHLFDVNPAGALSIKSETAVGSRRRSGLFHHEVECMNGDSHDLVCGVFIAVRFILWDRCGMGEGWRQMDCSPPQCTIIERKLKDWRYSPFPKKPKQMEIEFLDLLSRIKSWKSCAKINYYIT